MVGGAFGKTRLLFGRRPFAASPRKNPEVYVGGFADKMPLFGKQILLPDVQRLGKEFDLFAVGHTAHVFNVGKNIPCHVDAAEQVQFGDEGILRQSPLIAPPRQHSPDYIGILGHFHLQLAFVTFQI